MLFVQMPVWIGIPIFVTLLKTTAGSPDRRRTVRIGRKPDPIRLWSVQEANDTGPA